MRNVFLISAQNIKQNSVVNNNVDEMYILPAITFAQDEGLQPIIGTNLYNKLESLVADGSISATTNTDYKYLLDEYINPYLLNKVTADIQLPLAYKLRNQGVVQITGDNVYQTPIKETQYLIQHYNYKADFYASRMSDYLCTNSKKYPEYNKCNDCSEMPHNPHGYSTNIFLG